MKMSWTRIAKNPFLSRVKKFIKKRIPFGRRRGPGPGNHRKDKSRPVLQRLLSKGYNKVTWDSGASSHKQCRDLNRKTWALKDFLSGLRHDAPIFERSHPGDESCTIIIEGPKLKKVVVDSYGNMETY
jgi:hypothetical protein